VNDFVAVYLVQQFAEN